MPTQTRPTDTALGVILIADSGSTKTDWALLRRGCAPLAFHTSGINPVQMNAEQMAGALSELRAILPAQTIISEVYFYGAGCIRGKRQAAVEEAIREQLKDYLLPKEEVSRNGCQSNEGDAIHVESDMLGAARALCQREAGIACILGTGSNSCLYDGERILSNTPPLGYILGDEGSGAYIGRALVSNILKGIAPQRIVDLFMEETGLSQEAVIDHVYRQPLANRWLASLMPFVERHKEEDSVRALVKDAFTAYLRRNILQYQRPDLPLNFTGSISFTYEDILREALADEGMRMGALVARPIDGLITYHNGK